MGLILIFLIIALIIVYFIGSVRENIIDPFKDGMKGKSPIQSQEKKTISHQNTVKQRPSFSGQTSATLSKEKGDVFEKYIVKMFNLSFFTIKEWRGDKFIDGVYAQSNKHPDLEIEFSANNLTSTFAIECKFRKTLTADKTLFIEDRKLNNYRKFEEEKKIPVYIAFGLGGKPDFPDYLFLIPLSSIQNPDINTEILKQYQRNVQKPFYFNKETKQLS